jgi:hypothetical protein
MMFPSTRVLRGLFGLRGVVFDVARDAVGFLLQTFAARGAVVETEQGTPAAQERAATSAASAMLVALAVRTERHRLRLLLDAYCSRSISRRSLILVSASVHESPLASMQWNKSPAPVVCLTIW